MNCYLCGYKLDDDNAEYASGHTLCTDCYNENTYTCEECEETFLKRDTFSDDNTIVCKECYDEHYTTCCDCDSIIHKENAHYNHSGDPYCSSCFEHSDDNAIKSYCYKPQPTFFGTGDRFMGVEIEIDCGGESEIKAKLLIDSAIDDTIYIKRDGSLDCGLEIVSHPMTLDFHTNQMNWLDVMNKALELNYYRPCK